MTRVRACVYKNPSLAIPSRSTQLYSTSGWLCAFPACSFPLSTCIATIHSRTREPVFLCPHALLPVPLSHGDHQHPFKHNNYSQHASFPYLSPIPTQSPHALLPVPLSHGDHHRHSHPFNHITNGYSIVLYIQWINILQQNAVKWSCQKMTNGVFWKRRILNEAMEWITRSHPQMYW